MAYTLSDDEVTEIHEIFPPPFSWRRRCADHETMRRWRLIHEGPGELVVAHDTGAVMVLGRDGDTVTDRRLLQGDAARALLGRYGFRPDDDLRRRAKRALRRGRQVDDALDELFPRRLGVTRLEDAPSGGLRLRVGASGVLEIDVAQDRVERHRWLGGSDALDLIDAELEARVWRVPSFGDAPVTVRTPAEAELYAIFHDGDVEDARRRGDRLELLARTPNGRRVFAFVVADEGHGIGEETFLCLDPADLVQLASRIRAAVPDSPTSTSPGRVGWWAKRLRRAAAGLRQAMRFVPEGEELPPLGIYRTRAGEFLRMTYPSRFRRDALETQARELDALADEWERANRAG